MRAYVARKIDSQHLDKVLKLLDTFSTEGTISVFQNRVFILTENNTVFVVSDTHLFPGKYIVRFDTYKESFFVPTNEEAPIPVVMFSDVLQDKIKQDHASGIHANIIDITNDILELLFHDSDPLVKFFTSQQYQIVEIENVTIMIPLD